MDAEGEGEGKADYMRMGFVAGVAALVAVSGCVVPGGRPLPGTAETPGVADALKASPESRFSIRLVECLESRDFAAFRSLFANPADASSEVFDLLADLEPGDFVRMESAFTVDGKVSAEMSVWMVVREPGRPSPIEAHKGAGDLEEGKEAEAEFIIADSFVRFRLVAVEGEWMVREVEEFGEE